MSLAFTAFKSLGVQHLDRRLSSKVRDAVARMLAPEVTNLLSTLAKSKIKDNSLVRLLVNRLGEVSDTCAPRHLANCLYALAQLNCCNSEVVANLLTRARVISDSFNAKDVAITLHALRKLNHYHKATVAILLQRARHLAHQFNSQDVYFTLGAMATFGHYDKSTADIMGQRTLDLQPHSTAHTNLLTTIFSLARLGHQNESITRELLQRAHSLLPDFTPEDTSNLLNTLALFKNRRKQQALITDLLRHVRLTLQKFHAHDISNTLNALAKLGCCDTPTLTLLLERLCSESHRLQSKHVALSVVALAKLNFYRHSAISLLLARGLELRDDFQAKDVANTLSAMGKFSHHDPQLVQALVAQACAVSADVNAQDLANILSTMAQFDVYEETAVDALLARTPALANELKAQDIATIINYMGRFCYYHSGAVEAVLRRARTVSHTLELHHTSIILSAMAKLNHADTRSLNVLVGAFRLASGPSSDSGRVLRDQATHTLAVLYSLAVLGHYPRDVFEQLWPRVASFYDQKWTTETVSKLHHLCWALAIEQPDWNLCLPDSARNRLQSERFPSKISNFHQQVSASLARMGIMHCVEADFEGMTVDILLSKPGPEGADGELAREGSLQSSKWVVMTVDGPSHFLKVAGGQEEMEEGAGCDASGSKDDGGASTVASTVENSWASNSSNSSSSVFRRAGMDQFKTRVLSKAGACCISIPYYEWQPLVGQAEKTDYLRQKLQL